MKNASAALALAVLVLGCDVFKTVEPPPSPEEAVKKMVAECTKAANAKNVGALIPYVSDSFIGPNGLTKPQMQQVLQGQVFRNPDLQVLFVPKLDIKPTGKESADVTATVVFGRVKAKTLGELPRNEVAAIYKIEGTAARVGDQGWRFTSAKYDTAEAW
jgi:hypothetical protein